MSQCKNEGDIIFWEGFDSAINMVMNSLDNYDSNELAKLSVWDFIEQLKEDLIEEADLYKADLYKKDS